MTTLQHAASAAAQGRRSLISLYEGEYGPIHVLGLAHIWPPELATPGQWEFARDTSATLARSHRHAELYLADQDMCFLLRQAAPSMPDQPLRRDDPLADHGFLVFLEPFVMPTPQGDDLPVHAVSWTYLPREHRLLADYDYGEEGAFLLTPYGSVREALATGMPLPVGEKPPRYFPMSSLVWGVGVPIGLVRDGTQRESWSAADVYQQHLAAFWTLCKQPLVARSTERPLKKADVARFRRAQIHAPDQVQIVRLSRRARAAAGGGEGGHRREVEWRHQWVVKGHWRNQYYASLDDHRQIYIAPFLKGPEGAPLMSGEKAILVQGKGRTPDWEDPKK